MIDSLLQFLLEEVAMDGDAGTSVASLGGFVEQFYHRASSGLDQPSTPDGTCAQRVDNAFLSFVWDALLSQPGVRVGVLSQLAAPAAGEPKIEDLTNQDSAPPAGDEEGEEAKASKGKGKKKAIERKPQGPTHEVRILEGDEREEGSTSLQERYGDSLRILAGEETAWVAITGSHARPTSLTPTIYAVLQMISRGRDDGTTAVRISKEMGIDPKSVFHYIKIPQQLGIIKKFSDIDEGCRTNRVVHVRYLSTSAAWAAHIASEPDVKEEEAGEEDGEDGAEAGFGGGWDGNELTPISTLYLTTNVPLIRKRIVKALKRRKDWWMPHSELHSAIGLHTANSREHRRLNSIVSVMANEGLVEKIAVTKKKSAMHSIAIQALRLIKPQETQEGVNGRAEALLSEEAAEEDEHACPVANRALERQILDLLMDAGSRGLTNFEISAALGAYPVRFIDVLLQRFGRYRPPAPFADYTIHSVHETVGRVKQTRWFSLVGYLSFRRSRGFPDEDMEAQWREIAGSATFGGWLTPEDEGPGEGQYGSVKERHACLAKYNLWATTAKSVTCVSKKPKAPPKKRRADALAEGGEQPAEEDEQEDASPPPGKQRVVLGRPRKHPLKPGQETYYMRKKREKAEDEDRARQGLPPIERPKARNAKKKEPKTEEVEQAVGGATGEGEAGPSNTPQGATQIDATPAPAKKRGRPPKKKVVTDNAATGADSAAEPSTSEVPATPAAKPRKRARTSGVAAFSTPATPAAPTAHQTKATNRPRLEPYIDIPAPSASKKKKSVVEKALDAPAGLHSSSPLRGDGPASPIVAAADKRAHPIEVTDSTERVADERAAVVPAKTLAQQAGETPVSGTPAHAPPATPAATTGSRVRAATPATPVLPTPAVKKKPLTSRPSVSSRANLTLLARQQEVVDFIQSQGGVIEYAYRLNEAIHEWGQKQNPPHNGYMIDRAHLKQVLEAATTSGQLRRTVVTDDKSQRHDVFYLPSLAADSGIVKNLLDDIANRAFHSRFTMYEVQPGLVIADDEDVVRTTGTAAGKEEDGKGAGDDDLRDPQPNDGHDRVRSFFHQQQTLLGRAHGVRHGLVSRARQLHKWLASLIFSHVDEKDVVVKHDERGFIIAQSTLLNSMPLGVFLRIVPLPVQSETLDAFLAEPDNLELPMRDMPKEIIDIIRPRSNKRKQALWKNLQLLIDLRLLAPLVSVASLGTGSSTFEIPSNAKSCTHWRFLARAPIYALRDPTLPLVDVCPMTNVDEVKYFWTRLHSVSTDPSFAEAGHALDDPVFAATHPTRHLRKPELIRPFKWRDSYELAPSQRTFLAKLVHHDPDLVDPDTDRTADLEAWAACLLAPPSVVRDYLIKVRHQEAEVLEWPTRKKRRTDGAGDGAGDEDGDGANETKTPTNLAAALARKVREAADQRERDWQVIVDRFRQEHRHPDLDESIVDWLHKTFQDPRRRDKLNAKQLDFELRRLLPADQNAPTDPSMRTIVPTSLQQKARLARDPYVIKRQPNIRRRPVIKRIRAKPAAPAKEPAGGEDEEDEEEDEDEAGSPSPAQEAAHLEEQQKPLPFRRGNQTEFLTIPLGPRPDLPAGKRASRSRYTPEQDELLLDAVAVLKVRALHLRAPRPSYNPLGEFFPGNKAEALVKRTATLLKRQQERDFHERLVSTWFDVYKDHKDELDDPNPNSLVDFDLASSIRCMRTHVNKRALRLMGPLPPPLLKANPLPDSLDDFARYYHVKPALEAVRNGRQFDKVWTKHQIAMNEREEAAVLAAFGKRWTVEPSTVESHDCKHSLAMSAVKAIMLMEEQSYVPAQGVAMLSQFTNPEIKGALDELSAKSIAAQLDKEHRLPGRNFAFDERRVTFFSASSHFEQDLQHDEGGEFPLVPTEGEMMVLFDLVSDDTVELELDLSGLSEKTLDFLDYRTRQANDDDIECTINITQPTSLSGKAVLPQPSFLPSSCPIEPAAVAAAKVTLASIGRNLELQLVGDIEAAGETGLPFKSLMTQLVAPGRDAVLAAVHYLTSGPQPLAFFAGSSTLVLVSILHVASWTLRPVLDDGAIDTSKRFVPTMWTNAMGKVNQELWQRACAWVKGELWRFADQSFPSLLSRATRLNILSAVDLQAILTALFRAGKVSRRSPLTGSQLGADDLVDWDLDTWSFNGAFW
ncbi:B-block binding subunitof TFIIIC family protein [Rhodotorula toruloides]|uniref:B-block binding subunitof TFIIIC family protein n=1 Tax=Rhodotorula toruloides TaxID=5286 RepID=A0A511KM77_RHOTO|nr:B-block binding subunitof TFIIIC family protein [Rhodotorula toruloides]